MTEQPASPALPPREGWATILGLTAARQRLLILYILATGPLLILLCFGAWLDRIGTIRSALQQAESIARVGAQQQDEMIQEAQSLLNVIALVPTVRAAGEGCHETLRRIDERHQRISNLSVFRVTGEVACNSRQEQPNTSVLDRPYFQQALAAAPGEFVLSDLITSRSSGRLTMVVALALRDPPSDSVSGVISAGLNLDWFSGLSKQFAGTTSAVVDIIDVGRGLVVARSLDQTVNGISTPAEPILLEALRANQGSGSVRAINDGDSRIVGFHRLPSSEGRLALTIGVSGNEVLAPGSTKLAWTVLGFLGATAAAITLAWWASDRSLLRPIGRLAGVAASIGGGDLGARVGHLPGAVQELQILGDNFDSMAERLRVRDRDLAAMGEQIAESEEHHRLLADNSGDMISRFNPAFEREYVSTACQEILGFEPAELLGQSITQIVLRQDLARVRAELVLPLLNGAETARCSYRVVHRLGTIVWIETSGRRLRDGSGFVTVARDVTIQKALEAKLETANQLLRVQAMTDPLTGIANRRRFDEMLGFEFRRAQRLQEPLSLLMIDIDHFKAFNDQFGHAVGDSCLRAVAGALDRALRRPGDLVGRYGGEEFSIVLPGTPRAGAIVVAERIREALARLPMHGQAGAARPITVSIDAATAMPPIVISGPAIVLEAADAALYRAKNAGRDCVLYASIPTSLDALTDQSNFV